MTSKKSKTTGNGGKITTTNKKPKSNKNDFYFFGTLVILVIVIVSFVVAPLLSSMVPTGKNRVVFGKYGKRQIAYAPNDSSNVFKQNVENLLRMMNIDTTSMQIGEFQWIMQMGFSQSVPHYAILDIMDKSGFNITDEKVDREIAKSLQSYNYSFDDYTQWSKDDKDGFRKQIKESLIQTAFYGDTMGRNFTNKKTYDFFEKLASEKRSIQYVSFSFENYPDEKVKDFGKKNKNLFSKINLHRILVESEDDALAILEKFNKREFTFEQLAKAHSIEETNTGTDMASGELGEIYSYKLNEMFTDETAEALNTIIKGGITDPIKMEAGWTIYKIDPIADTFDIETIEGLLTVRAYLEGHEVGVIEEYINKEAEAFAKEAKTSGFANAASTIGILTLKVKQTDPFSINYGAITFLDNKLTESQELAAAGAATSSDFYKEIFSLPKGKISAPIVLEGMIIVAEVQTIEQATPIDQELLSKYVEDAQSQDFDNMIRSSKLFVDNFKTVFDKTYPAQPAPVEETSDEGPAPAEE